MKMKKFTLEELEVLTAITTVYQNDIDVWLLRENDEILQEDFAEIVGRLYDCYLEETSHSLLDLINKKTISLDEVL